MKYLKFLASTLNPHSAKTGLLIGICLLLTALLTGCPGIDPISNFSNQTQSSQPPPPPPPPPTQHLQTWTNNFDGVPFTMVGTDPMKTDGGVTTNIKAVIIPVHLNFSGIVLSPDDNACYDSQSGTARTMNSPLFTSGPWQDGNVALGNTQFGDAFQRANFWSIVNAQSPDYHVMLQPVSVSSPVTFDVPSTEGSIIGYSPNCPSQPFGGISLNFMEQVVAKVIADQGITPDTLPIFLTYDVEFLPENFLGYHSHQGNQTYIVASYMDTAGDTGFPNIQAADVTVLSHEIGEWLDNPLGVNNVPAWGAFGIQPTCGTQLEVGDPLTGKIFEYVTSDFTYHIQELAYFSWFARNVPSLAVNGRYSTNGSFVTPAPPCI